MKLNSVYTAINFLLTIMLPFWALGFACWNCQQGKQMFYIMGQSNMNNQEYLCISLDLNTLCDLKMFHLQLIWQNHHKTLIVLSSL